MTEKQQSRQSLQELLQIPWLGLRPDLVLYPGPVDFDGQRSWVLEDPVRGSNFRLGYAEGELLYRLTTESSVDAAVRNLYRTTTLRPSVEEILNFIAMLQRERLALLPDDEVVRQESASGGTANPSFLQQLLQGNIFFRIPLLRPDAFLTRTLPWVSLLWAAPLRWFYLMCGLAGLALTLPVLEDYLNTVNYLFTPQGALVFLVCLILLKSGHEFAHAYSAKSQGLHVRSMGLFFIVIWPLLYTDTTDAWKLPDRRHRMWISAAGVLFELTVGGIALLLWTSLPDGMLRSLMFFLSGTSLISTILINLNPFMRYDGYYLLMDYWGIDNLRPRAFGMLRHALRRLFLDWQGAPPEIHPHRRALIVYGFFAALYRLFIGITIALAVYYLFFPALGLLVFAVEIWLFLVRPFWSEMSAVIKNRRLLGSKLRLVMTGSLFLGIAAVLVLPLPRMAQVPSMVLYKDATRIEAPTAGRLSLPLPEEGRPVELEGLLARLESEALVHEMQQVRYDLAGIEATIANLGGSGEQEAYRKWLYAETDRLMAILEKYAEAVAQLEIRSPVTGRVVDVNPDLYEGAFVAKGTYLFTVADPDEHELKAFVHEKLVARLKTLAHPEARVRFLDPEIPAIQARLVERSLFPVHRFPGDSLFDIADGPIVTVQDAYGRRPRDAYFAFTFALDRVPGWIAHGMPSWVWIRSEGEPILQQAAGVLWKKLLERGLL